MVVYRKKQVTNMIIRNKEYIPHQAIIFTNQKNLYDFSLKKVAVAYKMRKNCVGDNRAICEIEFHPTNRCNLNCTGCSYGTRHSTHSLSLEQIRSVLNQYTKYDLRSLFFSGGGDPLLWEHWHDFFESIEKTCSYGLATNMFNFRAIKDFWELFDFYQIHVTGYNTTTSKNSTGIDSFGQIDRNISFLLSHKLPTQNIALKVLINGENYNDLSHYLEYVMEMGADSIILKYQQDFLVNRNLATDKVLDSIREIAYSHPITFKYDYLLDNLDDIIYETYPRPEKCLFANSGLYRLVNAEGEMFPCIVSNANRNNRINSEDGFVDVYSKEMFDGACPLRACRHYRFSQYLSVMENKHCDNNDTLSMPLML